MLYFRSPAAEFVSPPAPVMPRPEPARDFEAEAQTCLASSGISPNTPVVTERGLVLARDLKPGDMVKTRSNGFQPLRWKGESQVVVNLDAVEGGQPGTPVCLKAGENGLSESAGNVIVAAGQRILSQSAINELLFGESEALVFAGDMMHLSGVSLAERAKVRWVHLLFDAHEMIAAGGMWLESFLPDRGHLIRFHMREWAEICEAVPALRFESGRSRYLEDYITLDAREARLVETF